MLTFDTVMRVPWPLPPRFRTSDPRIEFLPWLNEHAGRRHVDWDWYIPTIDRYQSMAHGMRGVNMFNKLPETVTLYFKNPSIATMFCLKFSGDNRV